jgi:histidyl-tRNA synthetase
MPSIRQIRRLPNMNDASPSQLAAARDAAKRCMSVLALRGYAQIDTPLLEETELFLRKSGGELSSRLYDFVEPGGFRTSLRPEFTSPVIRYAIQTGEAAAGICRYSYFGSVFRYATPEHVDGPKTRQFNQLGAELIGVPAPRGDGEVVAMALEGLESLDGRKPVVALGHVGLLRRLLRKFQLSERANQFLLSNVQRLSNGQSESVRNDAKQLGLLVSGDQTVVDRPDARQNIESVLQRSLGPLGQNAGSRTRKEIIARLARKQTHADDPAQFESALSMLAELVTISGDVQTALSDGRKLASSNGLDEECFSLIEDVAGSAADEGVDSSQLTVRFGLARGVAYYTGMVFDLLQTPDSTETLGGGGRYDGLTRALGLDADVPALGFAYSFDAVLASATPMAIDGDTSPVLVQPADSSSWAAAARVATGLREQGQSAIIAIETTGVRYSKVIVVRPDGTQVEGGKK